MEQSQHLSLTLEIEQHLAKVSQHLLLFNDNLSRLAHHNMLVHADLVRPYVSVYNYFQLLFPYIFSL
jgi:hypothetical protein